MAAPLCAGAASVYDGFDYPSGASLAGQNGGSGWAAPWDSSQTALDVTIGPGLSFPGLDTSPGSGSSAASVAGQVAFFKRQLSASVGADNTTVYLSFLLRPDAGFGFYGGINLEGVFVGKSGITNTYGIEGPGNDISSSSVAAVAGTTVFLVLRADFLPGNDRFSLYIDPTPGGAEPAVADAVKTDLDLGPANFIFLNNAGGWTTDEIRIGDTFASVAPAATAPEPGTALGLGVGLLLLWRFGRSPFGAHYR